MSQVNLNEKRINFFTGLCNAIYELQKKHPYYSDLIPRVLANPIFDYTQGKMYSIGDLYHKDGNALKKSEIEGQIKELEKSIKEIKVKIVSKQKNIKDIMKLRPKKLYLGDLFHMRTEVKVFRLTIKDIQDQIKSLRQGTAGLTSKWMVEHIFGRDYAAKYILQYMEEKGTPLTPEETETLLKRYALTIRIEFHTDKNGVQMHTKANKDLEAIQKGNTTWEGYKEIVENCGYINFENIPKEPFAN